MNQIRSSLVGSRLSLWNLDRTDRVLAVEGAMSIKSYLVDTCIATRVILILGVRLRAEVISALAIIEWSMEEVEDVTIQETTQGKYLKSKCDPYRDKETRSLKSLNFCL